MTSVSYPRHVVSFLCPGRNTSDKKILYSDSNSGGHPVCSAFNSFARVAYGLYHAGAGLRIQVWWSTRLLSENINHM